MQASLAMAANDPWFAAALLTLDDDAANALSNLTDTAAGGAS